MNPQEIAKIVDSLMNKVDINERGGVSFTEYMVAAASREKLLHS